MQYKMSAVNQCKMKFKFFEVKKKGIYTEACHM